MELSNLFIWSTLIFVSGMIGMFLTRKHILILLISLELMILGINLTFILFALLHFDIYGKFAAFIILAFAASEAALGLAIFISYYKLTGSVSLRMLCLLKG